jgi:hypothetical protein
VLVSVEHQIIFLLVVHDGELDGSEAWIVVCLGIGAKNGVECRCALCMVRVTSIVGQPDVQLQIPDSRQLALMQNA